MKEKRDLILLIIIAILTITVSVESVLLFTDKKENNKRDNKKSRFCNYEQREYTPEFLESFYVNK